MFFVPNNVLLYLLTGDGNVVEHLPIFYLEARLTRGEPLQPPIVYCIAQASPGSLHSVPHARLTFPHCQLPTY